MKTSARDLIENFELTERHRLWAKAKTPWVSDVAAETEMFQDHFRTTGYKTGRNPIADVDAAWRNWMRRVSKPKQPAVRPIVSAPRKLE